MAVNTGVYCISCGSSACKDVFQVLQTGFRFVDGEKYNVGFCSQSAIKKN